MNTTLFLFHHPPPPPPLNNGRRTFLGDSHILSFFGQSYIAKLNVA